MSDKERVCGNCEYWSTQLHICNNYYSDYYDDVTYPDQSCDEWFYAPELALREGGAKYEQE